MSRRFIKIGKTMLNTDSIKMVRIEPTEFHIELKHPGIANGYLCMGTGLFSSECSAINVCKEREPQTYKDVEKWVNQMINSYESDKMNVCEPEDLELLFFGEKK